jgi:hypothetical protein
MECIKQTLVSKSPESVKAMDRCVLRQDSIHVQEKHYLSYHKIRYLPDVTFSFFVKKYVELNVFYFLIQSFKREDSFLENI